MAFFFCDGAFDATDCQPFLMAGVVLSINRVICPLSTVYSRLLRRQSDGAVNEVLNDCELRLDWWLVPPFASVSSDSVWLLLLALIVIILRVSLN